jgi:hypothetical protein
LTESNTPVWNVFDLKAAGWEAQVGVAQVGVAEEAADRWLEIMHAPVQSSGDYHRWVAEPASGLGIMADQIPFEDSRSLGLCLLQLRLD